MKNFPYLLALHTVDGLGSVRLKRLVDYFQDPKNAWQSPKNELIQAGIPKEVAEKIIELRKTFDVDMYQNQLEKDQIACVTLEDEEYPSLLKQIYDPPFILYYQGRFDQSDAHSIGVVGTRKVTSYGKMVTEQFATELSQAGLTIVSGLARGVDTIAHQAALGNQGRTIAVLGGGIRKLYPPENASLAQKIVAHDLGAVVSEFPPDYPHLAGNFPARNRIISGISLGVLITEAAIDSGSLITARFALDQGREIFAIPGPITSPLSHGPASLIQQGAKLVINTQEILDELGITEKNPKKLLIDESTFSELEKQVVLCLENESKHVDEICREMKASINEISGTLIKLEIIGIVKNLGSGNYIKY